MNIGYPTVGVCGLSCQLCPRYQTEAKSKCVGCKSEFRMAAGCPFITCAIKRKQIAFCWNCTDNKGCEKWHKHRELGKKYDSFKSYQKLEDNISFIQEHGVDEFAKLQATREELLKKMLRDFNEGRSKSYYCIAATVFEVDELQKLLDEALERSECLDLKAKSRVLHALLASVAQEKGYCLKLRK